MQKDKTTILWEEFCCEIKNFIRKRIDDDLLSDDIFQEVFIKIHTNIDDLKDDEKVRSWIYQITRNTIIDHFRNRKNFSDKFPEVDFYDDIQEFGPRDEISKSVKLLAENLPDIYKEAFLEIEFNGISQKALSERLDISLSTLKSRIQRAREKIRDQLMNCCHFEFDKYGTLIDYHPKNCCCCN